MRFLKFVNLASFVRELLKHSVDIFLHVLKISHALWLRVLSERRLVM